MPAFLCTLFEGTHQGGEIAASNNMLLVHGTITCNVVTDILAPLIKILGSYFGNGIY
jgi:hypothetical protein